MGIAPVYALADWVRSFQGLMPRGRVWPRDSTSIQAMTIAAILPTHKRQADASANEIEDSFPATAITSLADWEAALGLPDPCAGPDPTIAVRQAHVVARLTYRGGQSVPYFVAYAAQLGYAITIQEFAPARADITCADDPCYEPEWAFVWQITVPNITVDYASADISFADDPLLTFGNTVLQCEMKRIAPAHTTILWMFTGPPSSGIGDFAIGVNSI